jgi:beta-glucanase (GH16 family)
MAAMLQTTRAGLLAAAACAVVACGGASSQSLTSPGGLADGGSAGNGSDAGGSGGDASSTGTNTASDGSPGSTTDADAAGPTSDDAGTTGSLPGWTLTWSDEFNGADGSAVDSTKWGHDVGGSGWGNQEREYYTDGTQNAVQQGGNLVITATTAGAAAETCWYGTCQYTSARLLTQNKFSQEYGRFEARIQIPAGQGLWPAFWMLGSNIATSPWPACGEVDIMENIGKEPSIVHGSLHMTGANPTGSYTLAGGAAFSDAFHLFAVEWDTAEIRFYVDDQLYETQTRAAQGTGATWAFDQPFFLLLNVAVGGTWPGDPDSTTTFPQTMKVDWVRVYEPSDGG